MRAPASSCAPYKCHVGPNASCSQAAPPYGHLNPQFSCQAQYFPRYRDQPPPSTVPHRSSNRGARCSGSTLFATVRLSTISETQLDPLQCEAARLRDVPIPGTSRLFIRLDFLSLLGGGTPPGKQPAQACGQPGNPEHGIGDQPAEHQRALGARQLFHLVGRQTPRISRLGGSPKKAR